MSTMQQQHCSSTASVRPMTARSIFSLSVFTFLLVRASFRYKRKFAVQMCAEIHRHWQLTPWSAEKLLCVSDLHADISNIFSGYGENGVTSTREWRDSRRNTVVGGTCDLPSAFLAFLFVVVAVLANKDLYTITCPLQQRLVKIYTWFVWSTRRKIEKMP